MRLPSFQKLPRVNTGEHGPRIHLGRRLILWILFWKKRSCLLRKKSHESLVTDEDDLQEELGGNNESGSSALPRSCSPTIYLIRQRMMNEEEDEHDSAIIPPSKSEISLLTHARMLLSQGKFSSSFEAFRNGRKGIVPLNDAQDATSLCSSDGYEAHRPDDVQSTYFSVSTERKGNTATQENSDKPEHTCVVTAGIESDGSSSKTLSDFFEEQRMITETSYYPKSIRLGDIAAQDSLSVGSILAVSYEEEYPQLVLQNSADVQDQETKDHSSRKLLDFESSSLSDDEVEFSDMTLGASYPHPARKDASVETYSCSSNKDGHEISLKQECPSSSEGHTMKPENTSSSKRRISMVRKWESLKLEPRTRYVVRSTEASDFDGKENSIAGCLRVWDRMDWSQYHEDLEVLYYDTSHGLPARTPSPLDIETKSTNWESDEVDWSFSNDESVASELHQPGSKKHTFSPILGAADWNMKEVAEDDKPFDEPEVTISVASSNKFQRPSINRPSNLSNMRRKYPVR